MHRWFAPTFLAAAAVAAAAVPAGAAAPRAALSAPSLLPVVALPIGVAAPGLNAALPAFTATLPGRRRVPEHVDIPALPAAVPAPEIAAQMLAPDISAIWRKPSPSSVAPRAALGSLHLSAIDGAAASRRDATPGEARALSARSFDGAAARKSAADSAPGVRPDASADAAAAAPLLPPYLDVPEPDQAAWIAQVWAEAVRSKTGRVILARVQRLAQRRGRPVIVIVAPIGNAGEYAFDHEIVTIDAGFKTHPTAEAAAIFCHELAHVLQLAQGLPADAFEMELEAYLVQFRVSEELGFKPKRGSFHWSAFTRFKNDVDRFMAWLLKEYDGNLTIVGKGSLEDYEAALEQRHFEAEQRLERLEKRAAAKRRVIERMVKTGQPERLIEQYRLDELAPLEEKLRVEKRTRAWLERDLLLLRTPETRERYRRYATRVLRKARAYHERLAAAR